VKRVLALSLLIAALAPGVAAADVNFSSAVMQFMCTTCHEPLNQVNSPQAISEKQTLEGLIRRGLTLDQIKRGMEAQYGPQVLAQPPASGFNLTVYVLPPAIFLGGLALLAYTLPKWRERSRRTPPLAAGAPLSSDDSRRLDAELDRFI
jgi:cytochrome c-type biogenesis protein CcmH/NrfF